MAFTVEDGTGVADANSYVTLEYADAYFLDRANSSWASALDAEKQVSLIKATEYVETRWLGRWLGVKQFSTNYIAWPREYVYDEFGETIEGTIPENLKVAICMYAVRALSAELMPDPTVNAGYPIKREMAKVGPIEEEIAYDTSWIQITQKYPMADRLIASLLSSTGGVYR